MSRCANSVLGFHFISLAIYACIHKYEHYFQTNKSHSFVLFWLFLPLSSLHYKLLLILLFLLCVFVRLCSSYFIRAKTKILLLCEKKTQRRTERKTHTHTHSYCCGLCLSVKHCVCYVKKAYLTNSIRDWCSSWVLFFFCIFRLFGILIVSSICQ